MARILPRMKKQVPVLLRKCIVGGVAAAVVLLGGCEGDKHASEQAAVVPPAAGGNVAASASAAGNGDAPDTSAMGPYILTKINANPAIEGKATLVEFRQKSVSAHPLGDKMKSAVVEFEGVVTFSSDVSWSWQGPTKAGEPQKFEARAEYMDQGNGWQLVEPIGVYPL
jgi:hypothetical protein